MPRVRERQLLSEGVIREARKKVAKTRAFMTMHCWYKKCAMRHIQEGHNQ